MIETQSISYKINPNLKNKTVKLACFDLDHTLIKPKDGRTFPKTPIDFVLWHDNLVKEKIQSLHEQGYKLVIFSNQSDVVKPGKKRDIYLGKIQFLKDQQLYGKFNILMSLRKDHCRKPNTGMWDYLLNRTNIQVDYQNSFYIGDAAGRTKSVHHRKDFSCSDRMWAYNVGLPFKTPEEFFLQQPTNLNFEMPKLAEEIFESDSPDELEEGYLDYSVIMLVAPPASGKTALSQDLKQKGYQIVSQDVLGSKSKCLTKMKELLDAGDKIVLDNTNTKLDYRKSFTDILNSKDISYCAVVIDSTKDQCFFLNNYRCKLEKKERLSDITIHSQFKYYKKPSKTEGFAEIFKIPVIPTFENTHQLTIFNQYF